MSGANDVGARSSACGPPDPTRPVMTPAHIAVAIVAACGVTGTRPDRVFEEGNGRARVMAAAGCIARLGWDKLATARAFRVHPNRLTPSGLTLARVFTEQLLVIAEALAANGLTASGSETPAVSPARVSQDAAAAAETPQCKAVPAAKDEARALDPKPDAAPPPQASPSVHTLRANPVRAASPPAHIQRLKPVKASVVRWARQQLALGAALDFLAECFDVDVDDLAAAVRPEQAVAA